jgi:hypothetical protein
MSTDHMSHAPDSSHRAGWERLVATLWVCSACDSRVRVFSRAEGASALAECSRCGGSMLMASCRIGDRPADGMLPETSGWAA